MTRSSEPLQLRAVVGSSTFRQAVAVALAVWGCMTAALLVVTADHFGEDPAILPAEIDEAIDGFFDGLSVWTRERLVEGGDLSDVDALEEDLPPFEPEHWAASELLEVLLEVDEARNQLDDWHLAWQIVDDEGRWLGGTFWTPPPQDAPPVDPDEEWSILVGVEIEDREVFWELLDPEDPARALEIEHELERIVVEHPLRCRMRAIPLDGGGQLRLGRHIAPFDLAPRFVLALALVALGLVLALVGSFLLARRAVVFLDGLRLARERLGQEGLPRLRRPGDRGDLDSATGEINAMLDRLDHALGSLTHVTDNIAHDLRTPLTRLQGQLDVLRRSGQPTDVMIGAAQEEVDQLVATFNALLRIAQVESGNRRRGFRPFDLVQVVADVAELYEPAFQERQMGFTWRLPNAPVTRRGDPDLWMQALSNLLDNALKYTPDGGQIDLELTAVPTPRLTLRDSGPGIPTSEHDRVFERFYRLERHRGAGARRGAGLGLSLVAAVCDLHGARIRLENDDGLVVRIDWSTEV
ncbi:MAG: HAMP domain-containing sensor histidine kinase [Acidobacteriota bacterium]